MARRKRIPHNPAATIHDRRATDFNVGISRHVTPIEVDDPYEKGAKIITMRSTRNDPLAGLQSREHIDQAQYEAGRAFQDDWERAERGPRAIDPSKEAVDGGMMPEPITEGQQRATKRLAEAHRLLGMNGSAIIHSVLILGQTIEDVAISRQMTRELEVKYIGRRFRECLNDLAEFYGCSTRCG